MEEEFLIKSNSCTNESFNTTSDSDASLQALFSCLLGLMGITGFWLNLIVLIGVIGNAKLGTSINKLLAWICFTAMLEAVFGILAKALIIGQVVQPLINSDNNVIVCKFLVAIPFSFCNTILVLWTIISAYRVFLVAKSVKRKSKKIQKKIRPRDPDSKGSTHSWTCISRSCQTKYLPAIGVILGILVGFVMAKFSDSFVLVRECRGSCDNFSGGEWIAAATMVIPACLFHIPSSIFYSIIYWMVRRHQKTLRLATTLAGPGAMAIQMTKLMPNKPRRVTIPTIRVISQSSHLEDNGKEGLFRRMSSTLSQMFNLNAPSQLTSKLERDSSFMSRSTREATSDLMDPSSRFNDETSIAEREGDAPSHQRKLVFRKVKRIVIKEPERSLSESLKEVGSPDQNNDKLVRQKSDALVICRKQKEKQTERANESLGMAGDEMRKLGRSFQSARQSEFEAVGSRSNLFKGLDVEPSSVDALKIIYNKKRRRRKRRNIVSAKISLIFTIVSVFIGILLHFGYTHVPDDWTQKTLLRSFINAIFFDLILVILSPIILLYSSKELRKSLKAKCTKEWIFK